MNIRTDQRKGENYIPVGINAGGIMMKLCDFVYMYNQYLAALEITRTVRGSDYSPAIELSEQKDKLVTATGDTEKYSDKQANKVWLNSVHWLSRY